jgi:hypothetical protein
MAARCERIKSQQRIVEIERWTLIYFPPMHHEYGTADTWDLQDRPALASHAGQVHATPSPLSPSSVVRRPEDSAPHAKWPTTR